MVRTQKIKSKDSKLNNIVLQGSIDTTLNMLVEFRLPKGRVPAFPESVSSRRTIREHIPPRIGTLIRKIHERLAQMLTSRDNCPCLSGSWAAEAVVLIAIGLL